jgi:hypothetical protein
MASKTMKTRTPKPVTERDGIVTQKDTVRRILKRQTTGTGANTEGKRQVRVPKGR